MKKISIALIVVLGSLILRAQEEGAPVDLTVEDINNKWYASPWVWVAGAALIIILLVVLSSRGKENKR